MAQMVENRIVPSRLGPGHGLSGRILLIDDDPGIRDFLVELLQLADYEVVAAHNGETGVARLQEDPEYDLLLTDLVLPDMTGIDVVHRARRLWPDLSIIIVTGQGTLATAIQAIQEGAYDYIRKPFQSNELLERVRKAIETRRLHLQNRQLLHELQRERELLQVRVQDATASLRRHLHELEQMNREQTCLFRLVTALRCKTTIGEAIDTMIGELSSVVPIHGASYVVFDAVGKLVARPYRDRHDFCAQVEAVLAEAGERIRSLLAEELTQHARLVQLHELLIHGGVPAEELRRLHIESFVVARALFGVLCLSAGDPDHGLSSRQQQLLSLALTQMTGGCEENLLLERGTQLVTMGELISEIVHDLRSPLTALRNNARYLAERYQSDEQATRSLEDILESTTQMESLVRELLSFARPEEIHLGHVEVGEVLATALRITRDYLGRKNITVQAPALDRPVTVTGNAHQLVEAIVNLIVNATQAMDKGGTLAITVETGVTLSHQVDGPPPGPNQRFVRLAIADTGCGIPKKDLGKIFHRFYTTKADGSGLGLSAVLRIVRQNLGYIALESEVGVGTTAFVYLLQ